VAIKRGVPSEVSARAYWFPVLFLYPFIVSCIDFESIPNVFAYCSIDNLDAVCHSALFSILGTPWNPICSTEYVGTEVGVAVAVLVSAGVLVNVAVAVGSAVPVGKAVFVGAGVAVGVGGTPQATRVKPIDDAPSNFKKSRRVRCFIVDSFLSCASDSRAE
jgi:hypothetical protein